MNIQIPCKTSYTQCLYLDDPNKVYLVPFICSEFVEQLFGFLKRRTKFILHVVDTEQLDFIPIKVIRNQEMDEMFFKMDPNNLSAAEYTNAFYEVMESLIHKHLPLGESNVWIKLVEVK